MSLIIVCIDVALQIKQILKVLIIDMSDIKNLDTKLLLAFNALMEEGSVTRAAQRLNLTQQGLSGALHRMRLIFDDPLFVREARGVSPTPRAEKLAPRIRLLISNLETLLQADAFDPLSAEGTIYVATSDYALVTFLPRLFQKMRAAAPHIRLAVLPLNLSLNSELTSGGRIDFAFTIPQFAPHNHYSRSLLGERYLAGVRKGHPLMDDGSIEIDSFCEAEHLLVSPDKGDFVGATDLALAQIGRKRRIGLVVPNFSVAGSVLTETDLVAVLPERILKRFEKELHVFEPPLKIEGFELIGVWPQRVNTDPLHRWFRDLVKELTGTLGEGN